MGHGGARKGAGRPVGSGKFQAPTKTMRVPQHMEDDIQSFIRSQGYMLPLFDNPVQAGYPTLLGNESDAEQVNLYQHLIHNPASSFLVRAAGESMTGAGIFSGDMLVVEGGTEVHDGDIVVASLDGEFTVKRLSHQNGKPVLMPENERFKPIPIEGHQDVIIWGIVTHCIHKMK